METVTMRANNKNENVREERPDLGRRYGAIGISAVAAALRYPCDAKNPRYAPVEMPVTEDREDVAA
jgi:hypothetical protein